MRARRPREPAHPSPETSASASRAQLADEGWDYFEPYLPVGEYGPHPARLREQFEGVI
ncbi:hypothetical protein [Streptomyces sp. col6]|uniref:hypothetical protein n=1 Tax=Streptomyces sp. col6 TaxID=2478958 RepID=UPI001745DF98|nr:hypothetical protein [Streptomyces sp. col6]